MEYLKLVTLHKKDKTNIDLAKENAEILAAELTAKVQGTKAEIVRRESKVNKAKRNLEIAQATITDDAELWLGNVNYAQANVKVAKDNLDDAKEALSNYESYAQLFSAK